MNNWKCMSCEQIVKFKGLCRDCTEYGEDGSVITPVTRVRIDAYGNEYVLKRNKPQHMTHDMMVMARKSNRRLTKNQTAKLQAQIKAEAELLRQTADDLQVSEDGLLEIGEAADLIEHIHTDACNHTVEE